jgi:DNA-directed RNA polymerase subunit M/transcription elongation factor TFIIS
MATITRKQVCSCTNCGNEAEMVVTCSLPEVETKTATTEATAHTHAPEKSGAVEAGKKVRGTATCSHCGNEADMWIEL